MPKPIRITEEMKAELQTEFEAMLSSLKMSAGEINYSKSYKYENAEAILWLSPLAYSKTIALIMSFSDEVAWHGLVSRTAPNEFLIEDIIVYPQIVSGATVNTDQEKYTTWLYDCSDDVFNKIRMQGHSHVNMSVSPSSVDSSHREKILDQLEKDMFYIFMIWNKSLKTHVLIYDMANNILYEDKDIEVKVAGDDAVDSFVSDAQTKVQKEVIPTKSRGSKKAKPPITGFRSVWDYPQGNGLIDYFDI